MEGGTAVAQVQREAAPGRYGGGEAVRGRGVLDASMGGGAGRRAKCEVWDALVSFRSRLDPGWSNIVFCLTTSLAQPSGEADWPELRVGQ